MKRTIALAVALCAFAALPSARADDAPEIPGFVEAPAIHPAIARSLYLQDPKTNGTLGFVIELPDPNDAERVFELRATRGVAATDLDAYFYRDIEGTGDPCQYTRPVVTPDGGESGTICAGATHAVIVLFTGADVDFTLSLPQA